MSHPVSLVRRRLLQLAASSAALLWLPRSAWSQRRWSSHPFALGVASGAPTHDGVVLWTRLMAAGLFGGMGRQPVPVRWEVAHDEGFARIAQSGQAWAEPELAHSVHVEVDGLEPDRWYWYRFISGDAVSAAGRTRTFPAAAAAAARLRLGYASCQRWEHGYYSAYRHMREENLDALMFLGDYIYEYPGSLSPVRSLPSGGWLESLDDYRLRYAQHKADADLQAMHAACPWLVTWDDHEVQNDYAGLQAGDGGPALFDSQAGFAARRAAAYQAFYEHQPLRLAALTRSLAGLATGAELRLYSRQRFGQLATLHLLDARQYKNPQVCNPAGKAGSSYVDPQQCPAWNDPARSLLGPAQEAWFDAAMAQAGSGWAVIGQQTVFGQRDARPGPGQFFWNDGWDGYSAARGRFTTSLRQHRVANPVLLGGDVHENWVGSVLADYARPDSAALGVEFCGTSITSRSSGNDKLAARLAENPHFVFADSQGKGYGVAEFTPRQLTTSLRVLDDVTQRDARISTLMRFVVEAGQHRVERA